MSLRPDLQQVIDDIDAADRAAEALVAPLADDQFHWSPTRLHRGQRREGWSIAQCIDHLATTNVVYAAAVRQAVEAANRKGWSGGGPIAPTFVGAKFIRDMEPPVKRKFGAPANVVPRSGAARDNIMQAYFAAHQSVRGLVRDCAGIDVNRAKFANPFFPLLRVRVGTGLRVMPAHDRRHLWQARQVTQAEGFPR
jgi:hypothetical protein